jgi:hypothetical protein
MTRKILSLFLFDPFGGAPSACDRAEGKPRLLVRQAHHSLSHPERSRGTGRGVEGLTSAFVTSRLLA